MEVRLRGNVWYLVKTHKGKRYYRSTKVQGPGNKLKALRAAMDMWDEISKTSMSLSEAASRIYEEQWQFKASGELQYKRLLYLAEHLGDPGLHEIGPEWIAKAQQFLLRSGCSLSTVNRYMAHVRRVMRVANGQWMMNCPMPWIEPHKEIKGRERIVSHSEEQAIVNYLSDKGGHYWHFADLTIVLLDTGMRLSEALNMKYSMNIDIENRLIALDSSMTKSKAPRTIPLTDRVTAILNRRKEYGDRPFPFDLNQAENVMKHLRKSLNLDPGIVWHSMRHTCASRLISKGVDLYVVSKILGHSSVKVTERYAHMQTERLREAIDKL